MKILFVSPDQVKKNRKIDILRYINEKILFGFGKSLTFQILAALTPDGNQIEYVEGSHPEINYNNDYDIVGISASTKNILLAYEIADRFRQKGIKVVIGGWHASALPEEAKQHADSVVIGEAEETWPQLLSDVENNNLKPFYILTKPVNPNIIPNPKIAILPKGTRTSVQATRGCVYECEFCSIVNMKFRKKFRMRSIDAVIQDIKSLSNRGFFFVDNSLTINPEYTKDLFRQMIPLNKKFYAYGNINTLGKDEELLKIAGEAGCLTWYIGFESIFQETINNCNKRSNKVENYKKTIKKIHDYGMNIMGSFIFGFDSDYLDVFNKTDEFIRKNNVDIPLLRILTPFPGTPIYERLNNEGRILTKDWSKYDLYNVVFQPKHLTVKELEINIQKLKKRQYNLSTSLSRVAKSVRLGPDIFLETVSMNIFLLTRNKNLKDL